MVADLPSSGVRVALRGPMVMLVLAATAIPLELRPAAHAIPDLGALGAVDAADVLANIAGYVPLGIVLGGAGWLRAVVAAALISAVAETSQIFAMYRVPSVMDLADNVIGAVVGAAINLRWRIGSPEVTMDRRKAALAAMLTLVLAFAAWGFSGDAPNPRGATATGTLEAEWKFDERGGDVVFDSSSHNLSGRLSGHSKRVPGVMGGALRLDGTDDYADFGHSTAFRFVGSMTLTAWINSSSYAVDDNAIISTLDGRGYQLDTTVDTGPRTIGFKLDDEWGQIMARYGATPLALNTWYHVAGVYDANARKIDVYLNGELDDGLLDGVISGHQRSSREHVYVGRRAGSRGFEFAGAIDDVRIYSLALTQREIAKVMAGGEVERAAGNRSAPGQKPQNASPSAWSDREDERLPMVAALIGVLAAAACVGVWPSAPACLLASFASGLLLLPGAAPTVPRFDLWIMPVASLAGGASVVLSSRLHAARIVFVWSLQALWRID